MPPYWIKHWATWMAIKKVIEVRLHPRTSEGLGISVSQPVSQPCHLVTNIVKQ
jgi:hypothetical protein